MIHYIRLEKARRLPDYTTTYRKDGIWVKHGAGDWRKYHHFPQATKWGGYDDHLGSWSGSVQVHPKHRKGEVEINLPVAKILASLGYHVKLLPEVDKLVNKKGSGRYVDGIKSADFYVMGHGAMGGRVWELKSVTKAEPGNEGKAIKTAFEEGGKQWRNVIVHAADHIKEVKIVEGLRRFAGNGNEEQVHRAAIIYKGIVMVFDSQDFRNVAEQKEGTTLDEVVPVWQGPL